MADEPLPALFASIRSRPRPVRRQPMAPFQGFGGDTPGMRGTINSLDSQSMTDMAQGVDISSVAPPTGIRAARGVEDAFTEPTPVAMSSSGGGERSPFMFASDRSGPVMDCSSGVCRPVQSAAPQYQMTQSTPSWMTLNPGEVLVKDSIRDVTTAAPSPQPAAPAAPPKSASDFVPDAAAKYLASRRRGPVIPGSTPIRIPDAPSMPDPQALQQQADSLYGDAQVAAQQQNAVATVQAANRSQLVGQQSASAAALSASMWAARSKLALALQGRQDRADAAYLQTPQGQQELQMAQIGDMRYGRALRTNVAANVMFLKDMQLNQQILEAAKQGSVGPDGKALPTPQVRDFAFYQKQADGMVRRNDAAQLAARFSVIDEDHKFRANQMRQQIPDAERKVALSHIKSIYTTLMPLYRDIPEQERRAAIADDLAGEYGAAFLELYSLNPPVFLGKNPSDQKIQDAAVDAASRYASEHAAGIDSYIRGGMDPETDEMLSGILPLVEDDPEPQSNARKMQDAEPLF